LPAIIEKLVDQARAGDTTSAKLLLERVMPPLKSVELPTPISVPKGTLAEQGRAVMSAVASGGLAPGQASELLASLGVLARLIETDELAARIAALEAKHGIEP
jgi:hypothetical protein